MAKSFQPHFSISELAQELDITTRTIRYYEEWGSSNRAEARAAPAFTRGKTGHASS